MIGRKVGHYKVTEQIGAASMGVVYKARELADGHSTVALYLLTDRGRAIPLLWRTVEKARLKDRRNEYEDIVLEWLREALTEDVKVTVVADRGFMDTKLMEFLSNTLKYDYIIRAAEQCGNHLVRR